MSEKTPVPPSSDATRPPAVDGDLLNAPETALEAAWDEELVEVVVNLEPAIETLRSALGLLSPPGCAGTGSGAERR